MKFPTLQENVCGVGLPQNDCLANVDQTIMAETDNVEYPHTLEDGAIVSNLPLLFANGYPTSLEKITMVQLERFISFMVQCSLGQNATGAITKPQWWPKEVRFANPLVRPPLVNDSWMASLKKLVFRCYTYHRSEYILRFCSELAQHPRRDLETVNNFDSTTSLYHRESKKLLVTFRNENMNYDRRNESPRKTLLSHNGVGSSYPNKTKQQQHSLIMVEPPTDDIYLCDNCDAEFIGLEKMKEHEKTCVQEHCRNNSRPATPESSIAEPELKQNQFLDYFHLCSTKDARPIQTNSGIAINNNVVLTSSRRVRGSINFTRCPSIPFSSPAGIMLAKKSKAMTEETQQERLERIERHIIAPVLNDSCRPKWLDGETERDKWTVTHKPNRDKSVDDYVHEYKFMNSAKRKPMLSIQSQLLYIVCRPAYVLLTRLNQEFIDQCKCGPSQYPSAIPQIAAKEIETTTEIQATSRSSVRLKRKAPGDECENVILSEGTDAAPITETNIEALTPCKIVETPKEGVTLPQPVNDRVVCADSANAITLISLCSSDEEDDPTVVTPSDENRDPMKCDDQDVKNSALRKFAQSKIRVKSGIYPADSSNDNCTNKYRSPVRFSSRTQLSPIVGSTP